MASPRRARGAPFDALLIDADPARLPARLRALIDPDRPLDRPERFFIDGVAMPTLGYGVMIVGGLICAAFASAAVKAGLGWQAGEARAPVDLALSLGLLAAFAWLTRWGWRQIGQHRAQSAEVAAGRYRIGLYVEDDGLLFLDARGRVTWLPRGAISRVQTGRAPGAESGAGAVVGWVEYPSGGRDVVQRLPTHRVSSRMLAIRLGPWRDGRPFDPPTRG